MEYKQSIETISLMIITNNMSQSLIGNKLIELGIIPILFITKGDLYEEIKSKNNQAIEGILFCIDAKKMLIYEC